MILYHLNGGNLVVRPCARVLLKQAYQPQSTHSSRNSPFVKRWADVETPTRPGQEQEQASGTMRRSGSPDQSRSRKKLRPCHGQPGPALGVTPDPRRRRRLGRGGEGKKFSLTPETAPADAHHGLAERHAAERVQYSMPWLHDIEKRHAIAACQQPASSSRARGKHEFGTMIVSAYRDQPVQRVVWSSLSRFGTYCVVTVHATSRSPMDGERMARRCSDLEGPSPCSLSQTN